MTGARIFVVDDDADHRESLCDLVGAAGHKVTGFASAPDALEACAAAPVDLVLSDLRMPGMDGLGFLAALADGGAMPAVIMLSGHGDIEHAVRAMLAGAQDFLEKPYDAEHLLSVIDRALQTARMRAEITRLQRELATQEGFTGDSHAISGLRGKLAQVAPLNIDVILTGETGTGKELAARLLHRDSHRSAGPFIVVNCAILSEADAAIELFGRSKRVHGVAEDVPGRIAAAHGGTFLLDQIETLAPEVQQKLLRVLQTRQPEGAADKLDFRVIATTATPLKDAIAQGRFREDLYFRLAGYEIKLPALRQRPGDIPMLYQQFLREAAARHGRDAPELDFQDRKALQAYDWPGNAHELRIMADRQVLGLDTLRRGVGGTRRAPSAGQTLRDLVMAFEAQEIARVLDQCKGNTEAAARILNIPRRTLNDKIAKNPLLQRNP